MANPDPRVKWAMDVFDQEGEDFSTLSGKMMGPVSCAAFPVMGNALRNGINRVPLRTNMAITLGLAVPVGLFLGVQWAKFHTSRLQEETAMMKHYILTHPQHFPEPKKTLYLDKLEPWVPVRW